MLVEIGVAGDGDPAVVTSLYRWLERDPGIREDAEVSLPSGGSAEEMGSLDVINVVLTQGISLLSLAVAYAGWRGSRPKAPPITVAIGEVRVTLSDETVEKAQLKLQTLLGTAPPGSNTGDSKHGTDDSARPAEEKPA
jgi:hypothetical protein